METNMEMSPTIIVAEPTAESLPKSAPEPSPDPAPDPAPEPVPVPAPEPEPEPAPEPESEPVPAPVPIAVNKIYPGIEGPNAPYVKIVSADGHSFIILKEYALISATIKAMLSGPRPFRERELHELRLREIQSHVMQKVCLYFQYKIYYESTVANLHDVPEFPIEPEVAVDILMASNFLNC
ncbi:elongin-C-like [Teleopsis dalmanni]|uniref:elongin-C-like n=1 Tax=Teleopsis dalmanni TaxID=139649 RepID=UPI0018CD64D3|nr:elongin-C-like [Teleopsis dalmanni]XP_037960357.1 elongin-C-like [Teleopsis dalmanni]